MTTTAIIARMAPLDRLAEVAKWRGHVVAITTGRSPADYGTTIIGTLEAVAQGSPSDVAIVLIRDGYYPKAVPLATIRSIRTATDAEHLLTGRYGAWPLSQLPAAELEALILEADAADTEAVLAGELGKVLAWLEENDDEPTMHRIRTYAGNVGLELEEPAQ